MDNKIQILKELTLFEQIPAPVLEPLATYFVPRTFERGDRLWREGTMASSFVFIVKGQVKITKHRDDGGETILGVFGEDEAPGLLAVYKKIPYPASAYALEDTMTLEIHSSHFLATIRAHPDLLEALLQNMMTRNQELIRRVHELSVCSAEQRLAMLFLRFAESMGRRVALESGQMGVRIPIHLGRADIAALINVRVETAIRLMSRWNKEGILRTEERGFLLVDSRQLEAIATSLD